MKSPPDAIAELADTLDGQAMARLVADFFRLQKNFASFLGVGDSTVAGWMKAGQVPDHAKRAAVAAVLAGRHWSALKAAQDAAAGPKPVRDGCWSGSGPTPPASRREKSWPATSPPSGTRG